MASSPGDLIIEFGSSYVARYAISNGLLNDGGVCVCVEPNPYAFDALQENMVETKSLSPEINYCIIPATVGSREDQVEFAVRRDLSSGLAKCVLKGPNEKVISVPTRSLASLIEEFSRGSGVTLICDIEGAEIDLLQTEPHALRRVWQIAIELFEPKITGRDIGPAQMLDQFARLGFGIATSDKNCYLLKNCT